MKRILILVVLLFIGIPLTTIAQNKVPTQTSVQKSGSQVKKEIWLESLITATPQEGRELAIKMARKSIAAVQTDPAVRTKLRKDYAEDTEQLIQIANLIAIEFQTIAKANNYWK